MAKHLSRAFLCLFTNLIFFILVKSNIVVAQQTITGNVLRLRNVTISANANAAAWMDSLAAQPGSGEPVLAYVHFKTLPSPAEMQQLKFLGITLLDYVPDNTYAAFITSPVAAAKLAAMPISGITNIKAEWKADTYTWNKIKEQKGLVELLVTFYPGIGADKTRKFFTAIGAQVNAGPMEKYHAYKIVIDASQVKSMAQWYGVQNICPVTAMVPLDLQSRPAVKGNIAVSPAGYGLMGDGVTVGVGDNASGIYHADLKDRIVNFNPVKMANHGAHVNGIVGGAAIIDPMAEGMAPHVSLVDYLYDQILPATGAMLQDYNMTITNNSYGVILGDCSYSGTYDGYSRFLDTLSLQFPTVLHVFASGNDGFMDCSPMPKGFGTVGGGYQPAKNNVVVGSMTDLLFEAPDESRGPTKDGRLKPDVVAVGLGAYSTIGIDNYEWAAGTSMASPQAAGGLALLTQRYKQLNGITPNADILKTILLNGALDLGNPGPDFSYGYGAMDVARSLKIMDNNWYSTGTINNGDSQTVSFVIPAGIAQAKIMLCWADFPGSTSSAIQLVNDLDLSVITPASVIRLPLVPDNTPANVQNNATEREDHLNNTEQVTLQNPAAGIYTIKVKGYHVPVAGQRYVVAYDLLQSGIRLTYPVGGERWQNTDSFRVFWDAVPDTNTYTIQFSPDNGANWTVLSNTLPAHAHYFGWKPTGLNTGNCLMKISRNGTSQVSISGKFVVNDIPVMQLDTAQCPGYISTRWVKTPGASAYLMLAKRGIAMQVVDSITDTFYTFKNMSLTEPSYVAVMPVVNGLRGYRSTAIKTLANTGHCNNLVSNGDLMIEAVIGPKSGRQYTTTQPVVNDTLSLKVRNLYNANCANYMINYSVNGGLWQNFTSGPVIPAAGAVTVNVPGLDLSSVGIYSIRAAIVNLTITDPLHSNDSIMFTVRHLPNDTMMLPFTDGFEDVGKLSVNFDSTGITPNAHWDFTTQDSMGRLRTFVSEDVTITGSRSISLDEIQAVDNGSHNALVGTFNLAAFDTATAEVRVDFDYVLHGTPKTAEGNIVNGRAVDTLAWQQLFIYNLNAYPGFMNKAKSLSLTDLARTENYNFSRSFQLSFGQNDTSLIAGPNYGNGITIDNVKIYTVANDASLVQVLSPVPVNCGLEGPQPVIVQVHNGVNYTLHNIQLAYSLDSGTIYTGNIDSVTAKNTIDFTFAHLVDIPAGSSHSIDIWLTVAGDTYPMNDTIIHYTFRNNKVITVYPYLENFEGGNGGYYTEGVNNSWQYGQPVSPRINKAASGTKAWKTNLAGKYNNLEQSYLYSPCFDISSMASPMLSFSTALDIENCGNVMCDKAYVEYTFNGINWNKLGKSRNGTNWYDTTFNVWNTNNFTRWHVASIPIPLPVGSSVISFRFVLASDPGATFEGIAVDDIHIYDIANGILPPGNVAVTQNISGNAWVSYLQEEKLLAALQPNNQALNNTTVNLYSQETFPNTGQTQFTMPRSYKAVSTSFLADSVGIRLYLLDSEFIRVLNDTTCPSCPAVTDAYSLGITTYSGSAATENGTLKDDTGGTIGFYPARQVKWVPYDKGYYAETKVKRLSEFWLNEGGPTHNFPLTVDYLNFVAIKKGTDVQVYWQSMIDTAVNRYVLERSTDGIKFATVNDTAASHQDIATYSITKPGEFQTADILYYRLKWTMTGRATTYYSPVRVLRFNDTENNALTLEAHMAGPDVAMVSWISFIDGIADHYILERQINGRTFDTVNTSRSYRHYGQQYNVIDAPAGVSRGALIKYRLTAVLQDGSNIVPPTQVLEWAVPNSVTSVYPNPSTDGILNMVWYAQPGTEIEFSLTDVTGKNMFATSATAAQYKNTTTIYTGFKPKGIYILRSVISGQKYTQKVVFE